VARLPEVDRVTLEEDLFGRVTPSLPVGAGWSGTVNLRGPLPLIPPRLTSFVPKWLQETSDLTPSLPQAQDGAEELIFEDHSRSFRPGTSVAGFTLNPKP
jgi:hypothetical protein